MSYYTRQNLLIAPAQKWDEEQHPRVPAGESRGGQFTSGGGGGGGGKDVDLRGAGRGGQGASVRHHPVSFGSEGYGVERVEETGGKGLRARGATPERFQTMEEARSHAAILDRGPLPAREVPENPPRRRVDDKPITDLGFEGPRAEMVDTITDMRRRAAAGEPGMQEMVDRGDAARARAAAAARRRRGGI